VQGKHKDARNAFLAWGTVGKPRQGLEFMLMKNTWAQFKLALRYCREHEDMMRTDAYVCSLILPKSMVNSKQCCMKIVVVFKTRCAED
jgi:hypothetical protein